MKPRLPYLSLNLNLFLKKIILAVCTLAAFPALAQQTDKADSLKTYTIEEIVVTGARTSISKEEAPQNIQVISQEDIRLTPSQDFTDILKKNSTVDVIQYPGLLSGVGIRGFRPQTSGLDQRALLLIDGRPAGTTNLSMINPADIERVEVLKGPASALYGPQAMGGVINVITRKSSGALKSSVFAEYGSFETFQAGGSSGGNITSKLDYDLSFITFDRNKDYKLGENNLFRDLLNADQAVKFYEEGPTKVDDSRGDGSRRDYTRLHYNTGSIRLGYQFSDNWRVDVKGDRFVANNVESPSDIAFGNAQPSTKDIARTNGEISISGNVNTHQLSLRAYSASESSANNTLYDYGTSSLTAPYLSFYKESDWKGIQLKDVYQLKQHSIVMGIDYNHASTLSRSYNQEGTERAPYSPNYGIISTGLYVQGQLKFLDDKLILNPGARYDLITYDGKETPLLTKYTPGKETNPFFSPSLGLQYQLLNPLRIHASIGRAYVTPDAYNVAGYSVSVIEGQAAVTSGNPDLENENSLSWDAGIRFQKPESGISADFTYFSTHVNDRITSQTTRPETVELTANGDPISSYTTYINANEAQIQGLEAELAYDFGAILEYAYSLRLFVNATSILKAEEITLKEGSPEVRKDIYNVANLTTNYGLEYDNFKGLNLRLVGRYVGNRKDTDYNDPLYPEIEYSAFMVLDLTASYTFAGQHTVGLFVNNLSDENYYEKRGFNLPGRNFALRYTIRF